MATSAVNQTIPAPAAAQFTNGESAVGTPAAPGGGTYHFARQFTAPRSGVYLIKLWLNGTGVLKVGPNLAGLETLVAPAAGAVIQSQVYLQKGLNRIDVETTTATSAVFALLIFQPDELVYVSSAQGWVYNVGSEVPDNEVPNAIPEQLSVFSIFPNWGASISERISYATDVLTSETGKEQPRAMRLHARRYFEAEFLRKSHLRARLDAFLTGIGSRMFWMPLWHEQFKLRTTLTSSVVFPVGTLKLREFMVGDRVMVSNGDPDRYELLTVASLNYDTDVLTFAGSPLQTWLAGARIMPLRRARIVGQTQLQAPVDRVARGRLAFELVDPEYRFGASWGHCSPIWHFAINRGEDISFSYERLLYTWDNVTGVPEYDDPGNRARIVQRSNVILRGRADMVGYRRFIDMAWGRAGRFYMPTRMQDIVPAGATVSGLTLDAVPTGFPEYIRIEQWARSIIGVVFNDGSPNIYREVEDVQRVGDVERFTLSLALPTVNVDQIERIQFMVPSRFDQDTFEFEHLVDESAAVRTSAVTRSVDGNDMPDINC